MRGRPPTGWRAPGAIGLAILPSRSGDQDGRHRIWATDAQTRCELCPNPGAIFAQFNLTKHTRSESVPWSRLTVPLPPAPPASGRRSVASLARVPGARPLAVERHAGPLAPRGTGLPSSSRRRDSRSRRGGLGMRASRPGISLSFTPSATAVFDPAKPCLPSSPPSTAACRTCSPITLWILYEEGAGYAPSPVRRMPLARRRGPRGRGLSTPSGPPRLQARDDQGFSDSLPRINSIMEASSMREIAKLFFPASLSDAPTR